jgi:hypothetical protein
MHTLEIARDSVRHVPSIPRWMVTKPKTGATPVLDAILGSVALDGVFPTDQVSLSLSYSSPCHSLFYSSRTVTLSLPQKEWLTKSRLVGTALDASSFGSKLQLVVAAGSLRDTPPSVTHALCSPPLTHWHTYTHRSKSLLHTISQAKQSWHDEFGGPGLPTVVILLFFFFVFAT